jgi:hypothetical protein
MRLTPRNIIPSARQRLRHSLADDVGPDVASLGHLGIKDIATLSGMTRSIEVTMPSLPGYVEAHIADLSRRMSSNIYCSESSRP